MTIRTNHWDLCQSLCFSLTGLLMYLYISNFSATNALGETFSLAKSTFDLGRGKGPLILTQLCPVCRVPGVPGEIRASEESASSGQSQNSLIPGLISILHATRPQLCLRAPLTPAICAWDRRANPVMHLAPSITLQVTFSLNHWSWAQNKDDSGLWVVCQKRKNGGNLFVLRGS